MTDIDMVFYNEVTTEIFIYTPDIYSSEEFYTDEGNTIKRVKISSVIGIERASHLHFLGFLGVKEVE